MQLRTLTNAHAQNSNPITFVTLLCEFIAITYTEKTRDRMDLVREI